jgi:hypothetical protein
MASGNRVDSPPNVPRLPRPRALVARACARCRIVAATQTEPVDPGYRGLASGGHGARALSPNSVRTVHATAGRHCDPIGSENTYVPTQIDRCRALFGPGDSTRANGTDPTSIPVGVKGSVLAAGLVGARLACATSRSRVPFRLASGFLASCGVLAFIRGQSRFSRPTG